VTQEAQGRHRNQFECSSPNRKRTRSARLVKSGGIGARTSKRGKATASSITVEEDGGGRDEDESKPSLLTNSTAQICSHPPDREVVQEQATTLGEIPFGWARVKLEPDC
jgi:hypothetical protein